MVENPLTSQIVWFKYTTQITTISVAMQNVHGFHDAFFSWFSASSSSLHTIFLRETANWMIGISPDHTILVCLFFFWCSDDFEMDLQPLVFFFFRILLTSDIAYRNCERGMFLACLKKRFELRD